MRVLKDKWIVASLHGTSARSSPCICRKLCRTLRLNNRGISIYIASAAFTALGRSELICVVARGISPIQTAFLLNQDFRRHRSHFSRSTLAAYTRRASLRRSNFSSSLILKDKDSKLYTITLLKNIGVSACYLAPSASRYKSCSTSAGLRHVQAGVIGHR